ncbi:MAG: GNAT family N-acetyltransferase [Dehalococcoidales bacterium]|nr:MAG: GNAT family N-acetyltransferase [Dehalococcoidales bacterium]
MERDIEITDGFITLRPYQMSDIDSLYEAVRESITEVSLWMPWCHSEYSIEESTTWVEGLPERWEMGTSFDFAITKAKNGQYCGGCGLNHLRYDIGLANLGYWVRTNETRKGIATAATLLLARFGFKELRLNRVEIMVAVGNIASLRIAEKSGATREGVLRNRLLLNGEPGDAVLFSFVPQDFRQ